MKKPYWTLIQLKGLLDEFPTFPFFIFVNSY